MSAASSKDEIVRVDSLVESAFNSEENEKWDFYQEPLHLYQQINKLNGVCKDEPDVSERSKEGENHSAERNDAENVEYDQFSDFNDSGSSMTSNYSDNMEPGTSVKY